jgi:hypothetical protein
MTTHKLTTHEAETAGLVAAMSTGASRIVPPEYVSSKRLQEAWLDGFDSMAQSLRGLVIDTKKRTVRKPVEPKQAKPVPTQARKASPQQVRQAPPSMLAVLERQLAGADAS